MVFNQPWGRWGVGLSGTLPTGQDGLTTDKWTLGPALGFVNSSDKQINWGLFAQTFFSFAGQGRRADVGLINLQPIFSYQLGDGRSLSLGNSALVYDTEKSRWASLNLGVNYGQVVTFAGHKWRPNVEADYDFKDDRRQSRSGRSAPASCCCCRRIERSAAVGAHARAMAIARACRSTGDSANAEANEVESRGATPRVVAGGHDARRPSLSHPRSPSPAKAARRTSCRAPMPRWWTCRRRRPAASSSRCTSTTGATPRRRVPTAAGVVANLNADANTLVLGGGYGFEQTILGGAHYSVAAFLPYTWLSISGNSAALGGIQIQNSVSGIGDLTVVPVMLAWKSDNWQYDFLMPVYAPTGSYEVGRLGNTGLNYWTFDPIVGVAYSNAKSGLNAAIAPGLRDQHREQRHQLQERRHPARRRVDAADPPARFRIRNIGAEALVLPAGDLRQRIRRDARLLQGTHRRHRAGAGLHPADRQGEAALRVQVAAGTGNQESSER